MDKSIGAAVTNESRQKVMKILGEYGCYFLSLVELAERLNGKRIDAVEAYLDALVKRRTDSEAEVLLFQNGAYSHFVLGDGAGGILYDPLGNSNTVAKGTCVGKRIFERA